MNTNRVIAVVAGALFIIATVADLISRVALVQPILSVPVDLAKISANENQVLLGALFLFIGAAAAAGIAIALYPVLRKHNEGLALGWLPSGSSRECSTPASSSACSCS